VINSQLPRGHELAKGLTASQLGLLVQNPCFYSQIANKRTCDLQCSGPLGDKSLNHVDFKGNLSVL
jgi:hypothetical protein